MFGTLAGGAATALVVVIVSVASVRASGCAFTPPLEWQELNPSRRRAIRSAVRRGRAVDGTPAEAWVAAELASGSIASWSVARRVGVAAFSLVFAALLCLVALVRGDEEMALVALTFGALQVVSLAANAQRHRRFRAAFAANLERAAAS
jgi:hypothetical protein